MSVRPTLQTGRLLLRPFTLADADEVQQLASARAIAATTSNIPHPYAEGMAAAWISTHQARYEAGQLVNFAVVRRADSRLLGAIGLRLDAGDNRAELGYWIGQPYWNMGYCTEAAQVVLDYGFGSLALNRIHAGHFTRNPASGRVMAKIGMRAEGCLRQHVRKWGVHEDLAIWAILREEWLPLRQQKRVTC